VVPESFRPSALLKLNYSFNNSSDQVDLGNHISPLHCKYQPKIEIYSGDTGSNNDNTYTIIMVLQ
jgi:hypothetical protein